MSEANHTELPWEAYEHNHANGEFWASIGRVGFGPIVDIIGEEGNHTCHYQPVAGVKYLVTPVEEQKANLEFIIRACNSYYDLLALVERVSMLSDSDLDGGGIGPKNVMKLVAEARRILGRSE